MIRLRIALALSLFTAVASANTPNDYAYQWPLETPGDSGAWAVELTPDIYAAVVDPNLLDIEVFNAANEPVPVAAVTLDRQVAAREERVALPLFALPRAAVGNPDAVSLHIERDAAGKLRRLDAEVDAPATGAAGVDYLLDASSAKTPLDTLQLDWDRAADVQARFGVDASDDLQNWRSLVADAMVIDLHRDDARLARHTIALPHASAKYLRLRRLDDGAALTAPVVEARTTIAASIAPSRHWLTLARDTRPLPASEIASSPNVYLYRLPAALPVEAARVELISDNSIARLALSSRDGAAGLWQSRTDFTAFRLHQDGVTFDNDEVTLPDGRRALEWRIQSAQPLDQPPRLSLAYRPDRLLFLARGAGPYRLAAGSRAVTRAAYPLDLALATLRQKFGADWQPPFAALQPRANAAGDAALTPPTAPLPWKTWLLWAVLIAGAALVVGMALKLLREERAP